MQNWLFVILGIISGIAGIFGIYRVISYIIERANINFKKNFLSIRKSIKDNRKKYQQSACDYIKTNSKKLNLHPFLPLLVCDNWIYNEPIEYETLETVFSEEDILPKIIRKEIKMGNYKSYSDAIIDLEKPIRMD